MSVFCTSCGHNNPDQLALCQSCGTPLQREPNLTNKLSQTDSSPSNAFSFGSSVYQTGEKASSFVPHAPQTPSPVFNEQSINNRTYSDGYQNSPNAFRNQANESSQVFMPHTPQAPQAALTVPNRAQQEALPPVVQMGTISSGVRLSKVHAFAGRGTIITHQSWFLSEEAAAAAELLKTSFNIFRQRSILGLKIEPKNLEDHGTQTEVRHYLILQRSVATLFLYIAPAGNDLYISRVTTALTSIDPFRRFVLIALVVIGVLFFIVFPVSIPIWIFLIFFFTFSFRSWLQERDFWIYLRKRELNDFQLDDLSLIEHITDETVAAAAKQNKLDSDKLKPPASAYQHQRRIRAI